MTNLSPDDLRQLITECVQECLKVGIPEDVENFGKPLPPHVTKKEAARLLSCSQGTISNFARDGKLKRFYIGKGVRFDRSEVLGLTKSHKNLRK